MYVIHSGHISQLKHVCDIFWYSGHISQLKHVCDIFWSYKSTKTCM